METHGLALICAGLGIAEEDDDGNRIGYSKGEQCLENLKDLVRFLRRDDPQTREVFKQVCKWNIVAKDLIPMFQYCQDDRDLVLNAVKVFVFLTMPIDPSSNEIPLQLEYLWGLKSAITSSDTVAVIVSLLEGPLEDLERELFTEDDWKLVQLVLTLFRNILAIQDASLPQKVGGSACQFLLLRDGFLELLFNENVMDLILVLTQHVAGSRGFLRHDNLLLLEVFHYIFLGQDPDLIAKARFKDSEVKSIASVENLKSIMEEEKKKLKQCRSQNIARHSQFSGTFSRITMDGSTTVCKGKPAAASNAFHKPHAIQRGASKKIVWDHAKFRVTKHKILELLHDFMEQFLSGSYNVSSSGIPVLIQSIREDIQKEQNAIQKNDIIVFFQVVQFATSYQYYMLLNSKETARDSPQASGFPADSTVFTGDVCGPIAESMKESMFLLVISTWRDAFDSLKQTHEYKLLSVAGSLMKIMIRILDLVLKLLPENSKEPQTARILLYKLFYDQTDQGMTQFILNLIKSFNTHKQSKSDLADLVETVHVIVRLMGLLQTRGTMRVSKGSRKVRKKKSSSDQRQDKDLPSGGEATIQNGNEQPPDSGSLDKGSQENGTSNEHDGLNAAIPADQPEITPEMGNPDRNTSPDDIRADPNPIDDDLSCCSDDESADDEPVSTYEVDFNVTTFMKSFANHSFVCNLCWLLRFYKSNSVTTNHYIISMLRRITEDQDLSPMLYQLSLLTMFYDILNEQKSSPCKEYENIVEFLTTLVRRMLRKMKNQPLLFLEVLFWKSRSECNYINADYLVHELGSLRRKTKDFFGASADGEVGSSGATGWAPRSIADALGDDEADVVISHDMENQNMEDNSNELQNEKASTSGSSFSRKELPRNKRFVLTEEMELRIKDLYEEFKDDEKCCHRIAESLDPIGRVSPTQVLNKLKQLGLKASLKKRIRKARGTDSTDPDRPSQSEKITEEETLLKKSTGARKRAPAIGKDQEEKIRALYEQFKGEKRCSHMIADALAPEGSFTAAQVTRKLKQLGLHVPQRKRSQTEASMRDEEINDGPVMLWDHRRAKEVQDRKKSRKLAPEASASRIEVPGGAMDHGEGIDQNDTSGLNHNTKESGGFSPAAAGDDEAREPMEDELDDNSVDVSPADDDDDDSELMVDELEDDDVDASPVDEDDYDGGQIAVSRRKSRMVIDLEDEDEE
ncbi:unnamed protein product [Linum tenue]|uniref:Timeless N-terminal domain-containing protein n=1 Tax=Linum tenue TaxID=586396 RepID=A0AAV0QQF4_9ROSI|nr:unnamed protein product [Linum tenue]